MKFVKAGHIVPPSLKPILLAGLSLLAMGAGIANAQTADTQTADAKTSDGTEATTVVTIRARKLDAARQTIQPDTGASSYVMPEALVKNLPGGENVGLNQVILQAPGVAQDSYGQLHVRGDHNNIQFRLNGIILPEGLSSFGQVLSPRYAKSIELDTGALPAEYGLRTAGVVNITTQTGLKTGGTVSVYGGSHGLYQPSITYGGSNSTDTYFGSLSYQQSQIGIEAPYNTKTPIHDRTSQLLGFGYYDHIIDDSSRVSLIGGISDQSFQLPNTPGLNSVDDGTGYTVNGVSSFTSDHLNSNQKETTQYAIASYLKTSDNFTGQVSIFARASKLTYSPDWDAELAFNGVAQAANKTDTSVGLQAEGAWTVNPAHTVRSGLIASADHSVSKTLSHVFYLDDSGNPTSDVPVVISDNGKKDSQTVSLYVQDEWKVFDQFVLNYGLRYDKLSSYRDEDQLSPRVNFVWTPLQGTTVHGGYARYFTPPPYELIAGQTQALFAGTSFDISGANDVPYAQRDNYYDLGVQQKLGSHLTVGIDAYNRVARYLIDEGQFGAPIILTPFNYKYGRNHGTEFTANYEKGPFTAYASLAIAKAQGRQIVSSQFNFSPDDQAYVADHFIYVDHDQTTTGSLGMTYKLGATNFAFDGLYGSGLRTDGAVPNGARLPAYAQVNLSVSHHFTWAGGLDARVDMINALDRAYEIRDGKGIGVGAPQWGPRRGVFLGLSKDL
ncbi:TonB-dependent receptor [Asticcacaulis sp. 201]|uniref:TonB-dependent receptor n=1 Tax=Asticcacaulis sp. 201 TaxID=3028787 RepID=UPI00291687CE|nr:TonB-dependent receptor [Asticcacaulis sp. 201]MDV6330216.1 TonB-dependent receptor [Asticcacaulis sp. 201]